jgi:uncharacterized repeat protein (TIGR03803 family)
MKSLTLRILGVALAATVAGSAAALAVTHPAGSAPRERVLYSFPGGAQGDVPDGDLLADGTGALYGTTRAGGATTCGGGCGTVFKLTPSGQKYTYSVLYAFTGGQDGAEPFAGLVADGNGALYGTTSFGGNAAACPNITQGNGCGTVFKLTPVGSSYAETVLYRFHGNADGAYPLADLILDRSGALYGTTWLGGASNCKMLGLTGCGTVFKLTPSGATYSKSTLYTFAGGANDGARPAAALLADAGGALYGTTEFGAGKGTVFKLTPSASGYAETILYRFSSIAAGANPKGALIADATGALYSTTLSGKKGPGCKIASREIGCGTVFKLTPSRSGYTETVLHQFQGGSDGFAPAAGLVAGKHGRLYGTTYAGGAGAGTVFELAPSGSGYQETVLLRFRYDFMRNGGAFPAAALIADHKGDLYGTTELGGHHCVSEGGCGVVFRLKP